MNKSIYYCITLLLLTFYSFGQVSDLHVKRYTKKEGLSSNNITSFAQTPDGKLWIGTTDGLNRFDGYEFKVFRNNPGDSTSISDNTITALFVDHLSSLWVGTENAGLMRYHPESESFERFTHAPYQSNTISHPYITCIKEDFNHQLWVGTIMGLNLYHRAEMILKDIFLKQVCCWMISPWRG